MLSAAGDAELGALLDRIDGVAAGIGKPDDFCFRRLRLQQEGREVAGLQRMAHAAEHFAAVGDHDLGRVALERLAERVVGREEEPGVAAGLDHRLAGAVGEHPGVVGPLDRIRRAFRSGEIGACRPRAQEHFILLAGDLADRQCDARRRHVDDDVDMVDVVPLPREVGADIRLVLMIAGDDLDLHAVSRGVEILHRQFGGGDRAGSADVGIEARHVGQYADLDDVVVLAHVRRRPGPPARRAPTPIFQRARICRRRS